MRKNLFKWIGVSLKGISMLLLFAVGGLFGSDALEHGQASIWAILGLVLAVGIFWLGNKFHRNPFD